MIDGIIEVKQLPIIEERLQTLKEDIEQRTSIALSMECTEETVKDVKKVRAELNRERDEYETRRKQVKKQLEAPYKAFEEVYKECVTVPFKSADEDLKRKITEVENGLKKQKRNKVIKFAEELKASYSLDWLCIDRVLPNITLTASESSLMATVSDTLDRINGDCQCIDDPEIFAEYKKSLNLAQSNLIVANRRKEVEAAKIEAECRSQQEEAKQEAEKKVEMLAPPVEEDVLPEPPAAPRIKEGKHYRTTFTVSGTIEQLKALKAFIIDNNIEIIGG